MKRAIWMAVAVALMVCMFPCQSMAKAKKPYLSVDNCANCIELDFSQKGYKKYQVYMKENDGKFQLVKTVKGHSVTFKKKNAKFGTKATRYFKIRGVKGKKTGKFSKVKKVKENGAYYDMVSQLKGTSQEKVEALFVFFHNNYTYDGSHKIHDGYTMLKKKKGVCEAYSNLAEIVLNDVGVPCKSVSSKKLNHGWNLVKVKGKWYHCDFTPSNHKDSIKKMYNYLFRGSEESANDYEPKVKGVSKKGLCKSYSETVREHYESIEWDDSVDEEDRI